MTEDYVLEIVIRDQTREEILQKAHDLYDSFFLAHPTAEVEVFVMEVDMESEVGLPALVRIEHWPKGATGPFRDITWTEDVEKEDEDDPDL